MKTSKPITFVECARCNNWVPATEVKRDKQEDSICAACRRKNNKKDTAHQ